MNVMHEAISQEIWQAKYRHLSTDQTIADTWVRVARAAAAAEKPALQAEWQEKFLSILEGFKFLPGGRILAGAGTKNKVTLFNCFVMRIASDSLSEIFNALKEGALTLQQGGGVGYDFSILRPHGDLAKSTGIAASGPVSFMHVWNSMCAIMLSTGARRGAMMGIMRVDHPDIEEFITAKQNALLLRHFNVSVLVSDAFMQAVKDNAEWPLVFPCAKKTKDTILKPYGADHSIVNCKIYKTVNARALWEKIIRNAYDYAEPGVLFEDTINHNNNLYYIEHITTTNPCGEIPLPSYGACNLGAINLTQFVREPFSPNATLDFSALENCSAIATRFLDNIIDVSRYPLKKQEYQAFATRRIGLGFTGLADAFVMLGIKYGSAESFALAKKIMQAIALTTWKTSIALSAEKGAFPLYDSEKYLAGAFVKTLPADLQADIKRFGVRNSHHNTIAPTGTISILANNVSSGIEPIFNSHYDRLVLSPKNENIKYSVMDYSFRLWSEKKSAQTYPPAWVAMNDLTPEQHLQMQFAVQPFIDNAISKTINLPKEFPFEHLSHVYTRAHELGLKGCTIYRPNDITGSIIQFSDPEEDIERCCQI